MDKATESKKNFILTLCGLLAVMLLGAFLAFGLPEFATNAARSAAQNSISLQQNRLGEVETRVSEQTLWFTATYVDGFSVSLAEAQELIALASSTLEEAADQTSISMTISTYGQAQAYAEGETSARSVLDQLAAQLDHNDQLVVTARASTEELSSRLSSHEEAYGPLSSRYAVEHTAYLSKYMIPMQETLAAAQADMQAARSLVNSAWDLLPPESDTTASGDPVAAQAALERVNPLVVSTEGGLVQVSDGLDYQRLAEGEAANVTLDAQSRLVQARSHLDEVASREGFTLARSLAGAQGSYETAFTAYTHAVAALSTVVEDDKYDFPLAYEQASAAVAGAQAAIQEADRQVQLRADAQSKLDQIRSVQVSMPEVVGRANAHYQTLVFYHATGAWSDVAHNLETANAHIIEAATAAVSAQTAFSSENYDEANTATDTSLQQLSEADSLLHRLINKTATLEQYRSSWPGVEQRAQAEINSNSGNISSYGSYDSWARSEFNQAISLMNEAISAAHSQDYATAVDKAQQAESKASGTGARAYSAYQAEQRRQREAAERAAAAAAAAQRAAEEASRSSSPWGGSGSSYSDYGSGSSYGSSGSSSSCCSSGDSGGWGGGSYSSDGGGW